MNEGKKVVAILEKILTSLEKRSRIIKKEKDEETRVKMMGKLLGDMEEFREILKKVETIVCGGPTVEPL